MKNILYTDPTLTPSQLIQFTERYQQSTLELKERVAKAYIDKQPLVLITKRLDLKRGTFTTRQNFGKVATINNDSFEMQVDYILSEEGGKTVINSKQTFRFDSYFGEIPVSAFDIVPVELNQQLNASYALFLEQFKAEIKPFVKTGTTFNFLYHNHFVEGMKDYYINASVEELNTSNFALKIKYTHGFTHDGCYYNSVPRGAIIRPFITPITMFVGIAA